MLNVILHGSNGKMGKTLQKIISEEPDMSVMAGSIVTLVRILFHLNFICLH